MLRGVSIAAFLSAPEANVFDICEPFCQKVRFVLKAQLMSSVLHFVAN